MKQITKLADFLVPIAVLHAAVVEFLNFSLAQVAAWIPMVVYGVAGVRVIGKMLKFWK